MCTYIYIFFSRGKIMEYIFDARICFSYHECSVFSCMRPYQGVKVFYVQVITMVVFWFVLLFCLFWFFLFFFGGWVC